MTRTPNHFLREWRAFRNFTLKEVEAETGFPHSSIGRMERGEYGYTQRHLESLAALYRTTPARLLAINPLEGYHPIRGRTKHRAPEDAG